jgi:hypothetical protein
LQITDAPTRRSERLAAAATAEASAAPLTTEDVAPAPHSSALTAELGEPPTRTLTPPSLPVRPEPPIATFLIGNVPRLGVTEIGQGGLYYGRKSSVEEGEDSEEGGSDGEYEDSDALPWPPELLHRPQRQRRRPLPRRGAEE